MVEQRKQLSFEELKNETDSLTMFIKQVSQLNSEEIKIINILLAGMDLQKRINRNASA